MRSFTTLVIAAVIVGMGGLAYAELQNVEIDGSLRIRGNYYNMDKATTLGDTSFIEQRTRLGVKADFTDDVSVYMELDSYDNWGEDFRSQAYLTGVDARAASGDDVEFYQAYVNVAEMWGTPLNLRVGRQELSFGSQWLIGVNDTSSVFSGLSFDGVLLTYETDMLRVHALATKLAENFGDFGDDDIDLYGIYGTYTGLEEIEIDLYWLFVRDDVPTLGTGTDLHTVGLRGAGTVGAFDFELEVARQFGEIDDVRTGWCSRDDIDFEGWGINGELGYTFEMSWSPRVYLGFAWLEGPDDDDDELGFNRLWSNWEYSEFLANTDMSNVFVYRLGVGVMPSENIELAFAAAYFQQDETDDCRFLWWGDDEDDEVGWELGLYGDYQYSEDLVFRAGWAHFFALDGIEDFDGADVILNGLGDFAGDDDDDYDYLFLETEISF